jgi:hypothetical protein
LNPFSDLDSFGKKKTCPCCAAAAAECKIAKAKETEAQIDVELKDLQATLANIQDARPFEDLTVRLPRHPHPYSEQP